MIPFVIYWKKEYLQEMFVDNSYYCVDNLNDIYTILYKYIDLLINMDLNYLKSNIEDNEFNINIFYEMINKEPYDDYIFFNVTYFDINTKEWNKFIVNEVKLFEYIMSNYK